MSIDNLDQIFTPEQTKQRAELQKAEQEPPLTRDQQDERIRKLEKAVDILLRRSNIGIDEDGEFIPAPPRDHRVIGY